MSMRSLSRLEARALGVLVEKALTVPDSYPLSLNSLTLGCNQKTARDPVLNAAEGDVQVALDGLKGLDLAYESSGSRVSRYAHNVGRVLAVPSQSVVLLAVLMLRGPQTVSELRTNTERLHRFADLSAVEGFLDELAARPTEKGGALVMKLPRAPGSREARWVHLLCGMPDPTSKRCAPSRPRCAPKWTSCAEPSSASAPNSVCGPSRRSESSGRGPLTFRAFHSSNRQPCASRSPNRRS
jgi:uncharacterized protein YceH (UPF0502 family)